MQPAQHKSACKDNPSLELPFEVVGRAYEQQSPIVTTNLAFENWTEVLGGERLTHQVHILKANGESYRLKESRRRLKGRKKQISD